MENAPTPSEYSAPAVIEFLDLPVNASRVNKATLMSRKAACKKMLGVLEPHESADLRGIDLDQLVSRFDTRSGAPYSLASLQVYKSRLSTVLKDFFLYKENPANFRIGGADATASIGSRIMPRSSMAGHPTGSGMRVENMGAEHTSIQPVATINFPVPLRSSVIVYINGLPVNLTKQEAAKICAVVQAMATAETE